MRTVQINYFSKKKISICYINQVVSNYSFPNLQEIKCEANIDCSDTKSFTCFRAKTQNRNSQPAPIYFTFENAKWLPHVNTETCWTRLIQTWLLKEILPKYPFKISWYIKVLWTIFDINFMAIWVLVYSADHPKVIISVGLYPSIIV